MRREGRRYYDLLIWQQAMLLVTRVFPVEEKFGLISRMRRVKDMAFTLEQPDLANQIDRVSGLLGGLLNSLRNEDKS